MDIYRVKDFIIRIVYSIFIVIIIVVLNIINNIISSANIDKETLVIEIGPGAGSLTYGLATKAKNVLCYEIDTTLESVLKDNLKDLDNLFIPIVLGFVMQYLSWKINAEPLRGLCRNRCFWIPHPVEYPR